MTTSEIAADIRARLNESTADFWTDAQLLVWVNQRYHHLVEAVDRVFENYFITVTTTDSVDSQQEYSLPTDFKRMRRVEINFNVDDDNSVYQRAFPIELDHVRLRLGNESLGVTIQRNPIYYLQGDNIGFIPIPDEDGTAAIKLWYVAEQDDLEDDDDVPAIPTGYHYLIVIGACADALQKGKRDLDGASMYEAMYQSGRDKMQEELEDRIIDESKMVADTSGDNLDFSPR